jgi:hypothetical protein
MGDNLRAKRVVEGLQRSLLQVDIAEIVVNEAEEPNAIINFFDAERLPRKRNATEAVQVGVALVEAVPWFIAQRAEKKRVPFVTMSS